MQIQFITKHHKQTLVSTIVFGITLLMSQTLLANVRQYSANVENSNWGLSEQTRLKCELTHTIPSFGLALFSSEASKKLNIEFTLDMLRLPDIYDSAEVYSAPPTWMRGAQQKKIGKLNLSRQYPADADKRTAWLMLTELEKGFWPTIYYNDWLNESDAVSVSLNASNFKQQYDMFSQCMAKLLPFSFEDIAYTVLTYQDNTSKLSAYSKKRLAMIGEYLQEDIELELVMISAYTDSYGAEWLNDQLSAKRANEVKDFFADLGVDTNRIELQANGEKRHISPNTTSDERQQNKRVVIRLSKENNIL